MTQQYREVKRKANVGERIKNIVVSTDLPIGYEAVVGRLDCDGDAVIRDKAGDTRYLAQHRYVVLEPVKPQRPSYDELVTRVSELERKVSVLERPVPVTAEAPIVTAKKPLTRDEIVEKAKGDVAGRFKDGNRGVGPVIDGQCGHNKVWFYVNREKGTVKATLTLAYVHGVARGVGVAKCAPNECFNVHIGKVIALRRALGLEVPEEYVKAPQPTEPRVGDVVLFDGDRWTVQPPNDVSGRRYRSVDREMAVDSYAARTAKVIDDSRVKDGE